MRFVLRDSRPVVTPFYVSEAAAVSPLEGVQTDFARRPALVGAVAILVFELLLLLTRRSELAIYFAFGARRVDVLRLLWFESAIALIPAASLASLATVIYLTLSDASFDALQIAGVSMRQIVASGLIVLAIVPVVALLSRQRELQSALKDR